jgi:HAD superfamily hydrolase (TIGR01490 family)
MANHHSDMTTIAAFDFDGTITKGDSFWRFLFYSNGFFTVFNAGMSKFFLMLFSIIFPGKFADKAKEYLINSLFKDKNVDEMELTASNYAKFLVKNRLKYDTITRLRHHQLNGHTVVVISASPAIYIKHACRILDIRHLLATNLEISQNKFTGKFAGTNCRGPEKAKRLKEFSNNFEKPFIYAYGNSKNDEQMLRIADIGIRVDRTDLATPLRVKT